MKKEKKILTSFGITITTFATKAFATGDQQDLYGTYLVKQTLYGPARPEVEKLTFWQKFANTGRIAVPVVLFIIGLVVVLNKKITKKTKVIIVSGLAGVCVLAILIMNYLAENVN